jgi:hypothetical protein
VAVVPVVFLLLSLKRKSCLLLRRSLLVLVGLVLLVEQQFPLDNKGHLVLQLLLVLIVVQAAVLVVSEVPAVLLVAVLVGLVFIFQMVAMEARLVVGREPFQQYLFVVVLVPVTFLRMV